MSHRAGQHFGKYRLIQLLGQGGFAEVYLAKHIHLGSSAAVKILNSPVPDIQAFRDEARILASLNHPNIVHVIDYDVEGNIPFLVIGYASQGTLRNRHPFGTPVNTTRVLSYVSQIASALQYAHNHKVLHCDVKPENMLIGENDEALLSDFGLAVMTASLQYTKPTAGTAIYMAPEQIDGKVRAASDQYAFGVVVYEWLCGKPPFSGSFREITAKHLNIAPPGFKEQGVEIPSAVEAVVLKALAKKPERRFTSVQEFAQALQQAYSQQQRKPDGTHSSISLSIVNPTKPQRTANQQQLPPTTHHISGMSQSLPPLNAANPTPVVTPYTQSRPETSRHSNPHLPAAQVSTSPPNHPLVDAPTFRLSTPQNARRGRFAGLIILVTLLLLSFSVYLTTSLGLISLPSVKSAATSAPQTAIVPHLVGKTWAQALPAATSAGFRLQSNDGGQAGVVESQDPPSGTSLALHSTINVQMGANDVATSVPKMATVPHLVGETWAQALPTATNAGFRLQSNDGGQTGVVESQDPPSGTQLGLQSTINVQMDANTVQVPNGLEGQSLSVVEQDLTDVGLAYTTQDAGTDLNEPANNVEQVDPPGGTNVPVGSSVTIYVVNSSPPITPQELPTPPPPTPPPPTPIPTPTPTAVLTAEPTD